MPYVMRTTINWPDGCPNCGCPDTESEYVEDPTYEVDEDFNVTDLIDPGVAIKVCAGCGRPA